MAADTEDALETATAITENQNMNRTDRLRLIDVFSYKGCSGDVTKVGWREQAGAELKCADIRGRSGRHGVTIKILGVSQIWPRIDGRATGLQVEIFPGEADEEGIAGFSPGPRR
jgi:hypothetical protein